MPGNKLLFCGFSWNRTAIVAF